MGYKQEAMGFPVFNILVVATCASEKRSIVTTLLRQGHTVTECESCEEFRRLPQRPDRLDLIIYAGPADPQLGCDCPIVWVLDATGQEAARDIVYRPIRQEALLEAIYEVLAQPRPGAGA